MPPHSLSILARILIPSVVPAGFLSLVAASGCPLCTVDFYGRGHSVEVSVAEFAALNSRRRPPVASGISCLLARSLLAEVITDNSGEPGEVPRATPGSRLESALIAKIPQAIDYLLLRSALGGIHNVNHMAVAGIHTFHYHRRSDLPQTLDYARMVALVSALRNAIRIGWAGP